MGSQQTQPNMMRRCAIFCIIAITLVTTAIGQPLELMDTMDTELTKQKGTMYQVDGGEYSTYVFSSIQVSETDVVKKKVHANRLYLWNSRMNNHMKIRKGSDRFSIKFGCNLSCKYGGICYSQPKFNSSKKHCACKIVPRNSRQKRPGFTFYGDRCEKWDKWD